jgi:glycosyltransferase involved in cell wall biosynthesis
MASPGLHIGIDATTWANDRGFGRFTRELVRALLERNSGFRYTLVFDQLPDFNLPVGVEVLSAAGGKRLNNSAEETNSRSFRYFWKLGHLVRKAKFDVFFFPAVYSYMPLLARTPCVVCYHDATAERIPQLLFPGKLNHLLWQIKTRLAKRQTTRAMTISQSSAADLENILHIPKTKIDVVTEGANDIYRLIDDPQLSRTAREKYKIPQDADVLMTLGGMNAHKNILGALKAMPAIIAKLPKVHLLVIGDISGKGFWDNVPELMEFVSNNPPLPEHVHFTGYVGDEDVVRLLSGTAALIFPSLWEGFGLPAVEAMSCGVPVLSSDRGSLPEVIGDAGLFYDPLNTAAISDTVIRFFQEPGLRENLAEASSRRAKEFSWARGAELAERCFLKCADIKKG